MVQQHTYKSKLQSLTLVLNGENETKNESIVFVPKTDWINNDDTLRLIGSFNSSDANSVVFM